MVFSALRSKGVLPLVVTDRLAAPSPAWRRKANERNFSFPTLSSFGLRNPCPPELRRRKGSRGLILLPTPTFAQDLIIVDEDPRLEIEVGTASLEEVVVRNAGAAGAFR